MLKLTGRFHGESSDFGRGTYTNWVPIDGKMPILGGSNVKNREIGIAQC
jgi:hypothetical protein